TNRPTPLRSPMRSRSATCCGSRCWRSLWSNARASCGARASKPNRVSACRKIGATAPPRSKLRGELIEAHDVGQIADFVLLLGREAHQQRNSRRFEIRHFGAVRIDAAPMRVVRLGESDVAQRAF